VLLTALRFNNKAVAQIASDMLLLLADHVKNFLDYYPEVPKKIIEVLARYTMLACIFLCLQNGLPYLSTIQQLACVGFEVFEVG